ncbi:MAG: sterol desaturase family protein [Planctomycetota bacterium]|nr:sterol desaturase family protein [Planctomycetota bacterium]
MTTTEKLIKALKAVPGMSVGDAMWYAILAGAAYLFFHVVFKSALRHRRISSKSASSRQIRREILHSVRSLAIFGVVGGMIYFAAMNGWTQFYQPIDKHGWPYYFVSIVLMVVLHDAYFYWTHRLMHHRRLFKLFHRTHHLSTSPTPWAAYAFSPLEAFVQGGIGLVIALAIPIHPSAYLPFMLWQITFNVLGHCGYEIFPNSFLRSPIGKFMNSPTHHALHHENFRSNYSLYFNVWDRWLGTNHASYEERFDRATSGGRAPLRATITIASERLAGEAARPDLESVTA